MEKSFTQEFFFSVLVEKEAASACSDFLASTKAEWSVTLLSFKDPLPSGYLDVGSGIPLAQVASTTV